MGTEMKTVGVREAEGKELFIDKNSSQMVQSVPVELSVRRPQFGSAKGLIELAADFDVPLDDLGEYMS